MIWIGYDRWTYKHQQGSEMEMSWVAWSLGLDPKFDRQVVWEPGELPAFDVFMNQAWQRKRFGTRAL